MNKDIQLAINAFRSAATRYEKPARYYDGGHDLRFATEKFENTFGTLFREFALNLCPIVCDAVRDKLRVTGFSVDRTADVPSARHISHDRADDNHTRTRRPRSDIREVWHRNRMAVRAGELHNEVLKSGDAYAIVWPDEQGRASIYPNRASTVTVTYDDDHPGRIVQAAKYWLTSDKYIRLNIFCPDRIEKYISREKSEGILPDASGFVPAGTRAPLPARDGDRRAELPAFPAVVPNPFGVVPVFHFANNSGIGSFGRSELDAAIPIQDGLNKAVLDMLVAMEFAAFRQRWAAGIEVEYDQEGRVKVPFQAGVDHIWVASDANAKFGDFQAAELEQFLKVKDSFRIDIASVTGTPLHYFLQQSGEFASGESLKRSETRFLAKVRDRQASFGQVWADVMSFALRIEGVAQNAQLITEWEDPSPMSERERLENLLLKKQIGLPLDEALVEAGYGVAHVAEMGGKHLER
jgi:hypothetical protein